MQLLKRQNQRKMILVIFSMLGLVNSIFANSIFSFLSKTSASLSFVESLYEKPELLARANIVDGFNLPPMSYINNSSPAINDRGDVAFKVLSIESTTTQGIWGKLQSDPAGKIFITAPDERFITEPALNNKGIIVFSLYDEGITDGLFTFNLETLEEEQVIDPKAYNIVNYTYPQILDNGDIYFRATTEKNDRIVYKYSNETLSSVFSEGQNIQLKPGLKGTSSYIFRPSFNQQGIGAMKLRFGKRYDWGEDLIDALVLTIPNGQPISRVIDIDGDEYSQFKGISNTVSLNEKSELTFIGFLADGKKAIYKNTESETMRIAQEGSHDIQEIEYFSPRINANSEVFFRAKNGEGKRGIYIAFEDQVIRLIGEDDEIETDLGRARILWNKFYPGLSGEIGVNSMGDLVFHCLLVSSESDKEIGAGIVYLKRKKDKIIESITVTHK